MFRATTKPPAPPPAFTREPWFEALDPGRKAEFVARHAAEGARDVELAARAKRELLHAPIPCALVFAFADLVSPLATLGTVLGALVPGALVGLAAHALDFGRFRTATLGMLAFLAFEYLTRDGFAGRMFFAAFLLGVACAWQGVRREERAYE